MERLGSDRQVMLKLTLPTTADFYSGFVNHPKVARVVALSGGYTRERQRAARQEPRRHRQLFASADRGPLRPAIRRCVRRDPGQRRSPASIGRPPRSPLSAWPRASGLACGPGNPWSADGAPGTRAWRPRRRRRGPPERPGGTVHEPSARLLHVRRDQPGRTTGECAALPGCAASWSSRRSPVTRSLPQHRRCRRAAPAPTMRASAMISALAEPRRRSVQSSATFGVRPSAR